MSITNLSDFNSRICNVPVGKRVYLDGSYGAVTIGHPAAMHVLIAGGVGITPRMSMIRTLADVGDKRPVMLLYGSKDWDSITFRQSAVEGYHPPLGLTIPALDFKQDRHRFMAPILPYSVGPPVLLNSNEWIEPSAAHCSRNCPII